MNKQQFYDAMLEYEIANAWWTDLMFCGWLKMAGARYVLWKVHRKLACWERFREIGRQINDGNA